MLSRELELTLNLAFRDARGKRHEFITVEHLLLALLDNPSAAEVLRACAANIDDLRKALSNFIKDNTPQVAGTEEVDTQPTLGFQRVIQRAIMHVQSTGSGKKEVNGANVLVAIFGEKDSHAVYYLHQQGVTRLDVVNLLVEQAQPLLCHLCRHRLHDAVQQFQLPRLQGETQRSDALLEGGWAAGVRHGTDQPAIRRFGSHQQGLAKPQVVVFGVW